MRRIGIYLTLCAVLGCGGGSAGPSTPPPPPPPPPGGLPPLQGAVSMGEAQDQYGTSVPSFVPPTVTIRRTGTVTWTNNSGVGHTVTFSPVNGAPASIPSPAAGGNSRTFSVIGEFNYACSIHATMTGKVVVE